MRLVHPRGAFGPLSPSTLSSFMKEATFQEVLARLRRNQRCMTRRVARAEPRCRQLAACSRQRSWRSSTLMLDLAPKRVEHGTDLVELAAALFATRTANIKQLLAKAA